MSDSEKYGSKDWDIGTPQPKEDLQHTTVSLCSSTSELGDVAVVFRGCKLPMLLRQVGKRYQVVGPMYVYGFMKGEAVTRFPDVEIELV